SLSGVVGFRAIGASVASKHGVIGLTRTAALDYADRGIRVNAVVPGPVRSGGLQRLVEDALVPIAASVPMGRIGAPEEIAATAVGLCSDQSSYVTGVAIPVDGGPLAVSALAPPDMTRVAPTPAP